MPVVLLVVAVAILGGVVLASLGRAGEMADFASDTPPIELDEVSATDVALLRPPMSLWGYNAQATEDALRMIARSVTARDVEIATLRRELADLRGDTDGTRATRIASQPAGPPGPPGPPRPVGGAGQAHRAGPAGQAAPLAGEAGRAGAPGAAAPPGGQARPAGAPGAAAPPGGQARPAGAPGAAAPPGGQARHAGPPGPLGPPGQVGPLGQAEGMPPWPWLSEPGPDD